MPNPDDRIGPYVLVRQLGRGSYGAVWLAERRTPLATTRVAIKLLSDDAADLAEISRESQVWAEAGGHPNVLPIIEADVYDGRIAIVSEYAPDGSLQEWMARHGGRAPSVDAAVRMTVGILDGLEHLHARRIVHRDLKPANILLLGETPRLADFGLARVMRTGVDSASIAGTPAYMAPETFDGKRSERSDLWAVGVILYELLTGRFPFPRTNIAQLIGSIVEREPEPLGADVPEAIGAVVGRALAKDPAERVRSAAEMREALVAANAGVPVAESTVGARAAAVAAPVLVGGVSSARTLSPGFASSGRAAGTRSATLPTASATMPVAKRPSALTHPALWTVVSLAVILAVGSFFAMQALSRPNAATSDTQTAAREPEPEPVRPDAQVPAASQSVSTAPAASSPAPVVVSEPVATVPETQERAEAPAAQPGLRSDGDTLRGELPTGGQPAGPTAAASPGFGIDGTWEDVDQCAGSRFEIVRQGDRIVRIFGTAHCDGATIPWSAYNIRMVSATEVTYQTAWQSTTLTCKIHFGPGGTAVKSYRTAEGSWGSVQLRKVG